MQRRNRFLFRFHGLIPYNYLNNSVISLAHSQTGISPKAARAGRSCAAHVQAHTNLFSVLFSEALSEREGCRVARKVVQRRLLTNYHTLKTQRTCLWNKDLDPVQRGLSSRSLFRVKGEGGGEVERNLV